MSDGTHPQELWPSRLTVRDTKIYADEGQRIYTTATGRGYAKCEYVRGDIADAALEALHDILTRPTDPSARERVRFAIAKAEASRSLDPGRVSAGVARTAAPPQGGAP